MKILKRFKVVLFLLMGLNTLFGQVVIQPTALNSPLFNFDQLFKIQLVNTSAASVVGLVQVVVEDNKGNIVLQINSVPIEIKSGQSYGHRDIRWSGSLNFGNSGLSQTLAEGGGIPNGQYVYCYRFLDGITGTSLGSHCQENTSVNFQLPELVYPMDKAKLKVAFPVLSWRPPIPFMGNGLSYSLRLVQLEDGQSMLDAIYNNVPLLEKSRLKSLFLSYPPTAIPLEIEKTYAWQVTAFYGDDKIGETDVWEFSLIEEMEKVEKQDHRESFRFVRNQIDGSNYVFSNNIFFAYDNRNYDNHLVYSIYPKSDPSKALENLPAIVLSPGINQIELPVDKKLKLKDRESYVLKIINSKRDAFYLEFFYDSKLKK